MGAMGFLGKIFRGDSIADEEYGLEEEEYTLEDTGTLGAGEPFGARKAEKVVQFTKPFKPSVFASASREDGGGEAPRGAGFGGGDTGRTGGAGGGFGGFGGAGFGTGKVPGFGMPESADAYVVFKRIQDLQAASAVADRMTERKIVILNLENADAEAARRVMDFIGGVAYACNSMVRRIAGRVFMITPEGVNSDGEFFEEAQQDMSANIRYED